MKVFTIHFSYFTLTIMLKLSVIADCSYFFKENVANMKLFVYLCTW